MFGVTISSDSSLEKHVSKTMTCAAGFANFVVSESHLMRDQRQRSCTLLLRLALTILQRTL